MFKSNKNEISRGVFKSEEEKKYNQKICKHFTDHENLLLSYLMIIL